MDVKAIDEECERMIGDKMGDKIEAKIGLKMEDKSGRKIRLVYPSSSIIYSKNAQELNLRTYTNETNENSNDNSNETYYTFIIQPPYPVFEEDDGEDDDLRDAWDSD